MRYTGSLSKTDRAILESYKSVLDGFSEYLGPAFEFILHSLEDLDHAAIKVINGHYTGRQEGAPITDLAMSMLAAIDRSENVHKNLIYMNLSKQGSPIRSATLPIVGENERIIGLICINFYLDTPLSSVLEALTKADPVSGVEGLSPVEEYAKNSDELIAGSLEDAWNEVYSNPKISAPNRNKEIIALLDQRGVFQFKNAVVQVANHLGISKNTVYLHLRKIH